MKKFKSMLKEVSEEGTMQVQKSVKTEAPKKEVSVSKSVDVLAKDKSVANILDNLFILKSVKRGLGEDLTEAQKSAFLNAVNEKAGTVIADITEIIPSGFTGNFIQDMYAQTQMSQLFGYESIANFGITDAIGDFGMTAYIMDELGTVNDSNDVVIDFMYLGKKFGAKTYFSAEALNDANINLLDNKRMGLMRAMAVGLEQAIISGQAGDNGVASNDTKNLFRGLRKYGLTKNPVDFGGATITEATFKAKVLAMQEAGGEYTSWDEIGAGNVVLILDNATYNAILGFDQFTDASKAGRGSTLVSGVRVDSVFGIPVVVNKFLPKVDATGVVHATAGNNTFSTCILVNTRTVKLYEISGSSKINSEYKIETDSYVSVANHRIGFASIFDQTSSAPTTIDSTRKNIQVGVNIKPA